MTELAPVNRRWTPTGHLWPILGAACLGVIVAASAWFAVSVWEERLAKAKFTNVAGDYGAVLQNGLDQYLSKLLATRAFYDASVEVDADEFDLFTSQITAGYDETMRLVWAPRVTRDERAEFERKQRERGTPRFFDPDVVAVESDGGIARARRVLPHSLFDGRLQASGHAGHRPQFRTRPHRGDPPGARGQPHGDGPGYSAPQPDQRTPRRLPRRDSDLPPGCRTE